MPSCGGGSNNGPTVCSNYNVFYCTPGSECSPCDSCTYCSGVSYTTIQCGPNGTWPDFTDQGGPICADEAPQCSAPPCLSGSVFQGGCCIGCGSLGSAFFAPNEGDTCPAGSSYDGDFSSGGCCQYESSDASSSGGNSCVWPPSAQPDGSATCPYGAVDTQGCCNPCPGFVMPSASNTCPDDYVLHFFGGYPFFCCPISDSSSDAGSDAEGSDVSLDAPGESGADGTADVKVCPDGGRAHCNF